MCGNGTVIYNGKCVYHQIFCLDYDINGNCSIVPRDFYLKGFTVSSYSASSWDFFGNFQTCMNNYSIVQANCVIKIGFCSQYDQMSNCKSCLNNYHLN